MSETKTTISSASANDPSGFPDDLGRTLIESQNQIDRELAEVCQLKADPEAFLKNRQKVISEALSNGKVFYKKKDYAKAFAEWEKIFPYLADNDEFKHQARKLKESHLNLMHANEELDQVKQVLLQRTSPAPSQTKYLEAEGQAAVAQVKNVYAAISRQLRTERSTKKMMPWMAILASILLLAGIVVAVLIFQKAQRISPVAMDPIEVNDQALDASNLDRENQIELLNRKHAEASRKDREKIIQLETELNEAKNANADLKRRVNALAEDNLSKDETISNLS